MHGLPPRKINTLMPKLKAQHRMKQALINNNNTKREHTHNPHTLQTNCKENYSYPPLICPKDKDTFTTAHGNGTC